MALKHTPIHPLLTRRVPFVKGGGWEFFCEVCGYRAHYWIDPRTGSQKLLVLNAGDESARHTGTPAPARALAALMPPVEEQTAQDMPEFIVLPPDLEEQVTQILRRMKWQE